MTALVRKASSLPAQQNLTVVEGTPLKREDLDRAIAASKTPPRAIVSTLGQTRKSGNPWSAPTSPRMFMAESMRNVVEAARVHKIPKLVITSMWGAKDSFKSMNFLLRFVMAWSNMAQTVEDHDAVDEIVRHSGINFVLVRPVILKGDGMTEVKDLGDHGERAPFMPFISPNMVAGFLVDAVEKDTWDGRTPVLSA